MSSTTLTLVISGATAVLASGVSWLLYRWNRDKIQAETLVIRDDAARRLREDLVTADTLVQRLRAEVAWLWHLVTTHWRDHHPDEPLPTMEEDDRAAS